MSGYILWIPFREDVRTPIEIAHPSPATVRSPVTHGQIPGAVGSQPMDVARMQGVGVGTHIPLVKRFGFKHGGEASEVWSKMDLYIDFNGNFHLNPRHPGHRVTLAPHMLAEYLWSYRFWCYSRLITLIHGKQFRFFSHCSLVGTGV